MTKLIKEKAIQKAIQSNCNYKVSAIGFNKKGDLIGSAFNGHRLSNARGTGLHAEHALIRRYGANLKSIIICRTNDKGGSILPIHPCRNCQKMADKLGIKIVSIED